MHTRLHKKGLGNRLECGRANIMLTLPHVVWFPDPPKFMSNPHHLGMTYMYMYIQTKAGDK